MKRKQHVYLSKTSHLFATRIILRVLKSDQSYRRTRDGHVIFPRRSVIERRENYSVGQKGRGMESIVYLSMCNILGSCYISVHLVRARCGLATGQDELREPSFWENFSKMQEVAATATKHMRDLWPRSALSSLFRFSGSAEVMGTHGGPAGTRALWDLPPPLGDGVFFCRVIDGQVSGCPYDRETRLKISSIAILGISGLFCGRG